MNRYIIFLSIILQLSSCTFHSMQYEALKELVTEEKSSSIPKKNWTIFWGDKVIDLYAINFEDQVIFVDEKINIFLKDRQIYKITGLLPEDSVIEIDSNDDLLVYILNGREISIDSCEEGQLIVLNNYNQKYSRSCSNNKDDNSYDNYIIYNSEGMITGMLFKINPDYPLLQLSLK